jgi:drug/metabolite transporter (DMT)-like permease
MLLPIAFALAAALLYALGSALQQRVAVEHASTLVLMRRPRWLAGVVADGAGYVAQATALAAGRLAVVQPLLVTTLVFALPLAGRRVQRRELVAALAVVAGLALFVTLADPAGGRADAPPAVWVAIFAACAAVFVCFRGGAVRIGCATGVLFGVSAALTKDVVADHTLLDWHVVALVAVGAASLERSQASLRAGSLGTAVAAQMAFDAVTSVLIGVLAFGERLHASPLMAAAALTALTVALAGIARLARST